MEATFAAAQGASMGVYGRIGAFLFSDLFAAGEQGVIFDPSVSGILYQTTAMVLPALPGDPVGMMLDQSQWAGAGLGSLYGAELVTNGGFATDTDWQKGAGWTISGGVATASSVAGFVSISQLTFPFTAGKVYEITYTIISVTAGSVRVSFTGGTQATGTTRTTSGTVTETLVANTGNDQLNLQAAAGGFSGTIDNVSVREVTVASALAPIVGPELQDAPVVDFTLAPWSGTNATYGVNSITATQQYSKASRQLSTASAGWFLITADIEVLSGGPWSYYIRSNLVPGEAGAYYDSLTVSTRKTVSYIQYTSASSGISLSLEFRGSTNFGTIKVYSASAKEIPGYHATQATAAKRPIYGIHPFGGRRNLLTYSEAFTDATWVKASGVTVSDTQALNEGTATGYHNLERVASVAVGQSYTYRIRASYGSAPFMHVAIADTATPSTYFSAVFNLQTGVVVTSAAAGGGYSVTAATIEPVGDGNFDCIVTGVVGSTSSPRVYVSPGSTGVIGSYGLQSYTGTSRTINLVHAQLELGSTATPYQKVTSQYVVTETGVPSVHYLRFDGVDDAMATPTIDFTGTDEMSVLAGVRKLSDAAAGYVLETSPNYFNNNGTIAITFPNGTSATAAYLSKGTAAGYNIASSVAAPLTAVLTGLSSISGATMGFRVSGTPYTSLVVDALGTGNYGNWPLYIGARNGSSTYFNGNIYGLTVRGALTDATTLANAEKLLAKKTGVTL